VLPHSSGSNRTIVGLKLSPILSQMQAMGLQQSHHCGIETITLRKIDIVSPRSNRTIVGLKRRRLTNGSPTLNGSNRTIVGLKLSVFGISSCVTE